MTACCETKRADLTSEEGGRGDGSTGVTETERVDGVTCDEDGNPEELICEQSSQDGCLAAEARPLTIADAGNYYGNELSLREGRFVGENNADSNALISRDLDESAGVSGSSNTSARPISGENSLPVCSNYPVNVSLPHLSYVNTTTSVTSSASDSKCNFSTPSQKTNSDTFVRDDSQLCCHQDSPCRCLDVTKPGLTACDDGREASGACVGNETTSNNLVTSHRSSSGVARDNSISSPGFAGSERQTVDSNISLSVPRVVDHRPFQSAADETGSTGAATLNNQVKSDNCIQRDSSIQAGHYWSARCLDFDSENKDKYARSFHLGLSEITDKDSSITECQIDSGGKYSLQDYFVSSGKSCKDLCQGASKCFNVDAAHQLLIDNSRLIPHTDTEQVPCSSSHISAPTVASYDRQDVGNRHVSQCLEQLRSNESQCLEQLISEQCSTSDDCQAQKADTSDPHELVQGETKASSVKHSNLVAASCNFPNGPGLANSTQQPLVSELNALELASCHSLIEPTGDRNAHTDPGNIYPTSWLSSSCSDLVTSSCCQFPSRELTNQRAQTHPLIESVPHARADVSIIDSAQTRLSVSDSDQSTEAINHVTLEHDSSLNCPTTQLSSGAYINKLCHYSAQSPCHQKPVSQIRIQESEQFTGRQSLHNASRTLSTSSEEWSDAASPSNNEYSDKEIHDSSFVSVEDTTNIGLQQRRRSFGRQRQRANHSLGASFRFLREDSQLRNEPASDDDGCDATSALLTADSDEFQQQGDIEDFNSGITSHHDCDGIALVSKQQHRQRAKNPHEKAVSGRTHFSRLVQFYCKDILRIRNSSSGNNNSHTTSATCTELNGDSSRHLSHVHTNTSTTTASASTTASSSSVASGTSTATANGPTEASSKPRVSFISGLRRLSRDRPAFLRVDHSDFTECTSGSSSHLHDGSADTEVHKTGKKTGIGDRKKLKVEFAVMEGEGEKYIRGRGRGLGGGNYGGGLHNVKDDVENDVAMLGGGGLRFRQPRVSLLGKPLNYRAHRRDIKYRKLQSRIYNFLERPKSWQSWIYHLTVFMFVLLCLTLSVLSSITEFENILIQYAVYVEVVMLIWIMVELILRVWSAGCRSRYQGKTGRMRFLRRPLCIIDIILTLASICTLAAGSTQDQFPQTVLSGLRFFQILRVVRLDRKGGTWKLLGSVVWAHRQELVTTLYIGLLGLVFSSYFVYLAEKDEPRHDNGPLQQLNNSSFKPKFSNFADAIWWGVVTLCTVGYGDVVPATWGGKVIASFSAILGISFFALPAGILGSGFALKVQQQQRQKHLNRRRVPAANLIQSLWRCYAADEHSMSTATWRPHLIPCPSPTSERTFKNNTSFVSRFSTRRRDRSSTAGSLTSRDGIVSQAQSPMSNRQGSRRAAISTSEEEVPNVLDRSHLSLATGLTEQKLQLDPFPFKKENSVSSIGKESEDEPDLSPRLTQLTDQHKRAIRAIRKIRYFVARRKFREALRPYDVKDVIEQYSAGHVDMLGRIKNLQGRLDQILGRQGSKSKDVYESKVCLASRIVKVERQVEDIESKLDLLVDMYQEDRKLLMQQLQQSYGGPSVGGSCHPPPPPPAPSSQFKPRPILIDKQFTSEPATPTGVGFVTLPDGRQQPMKPVIQRNLSDLSQRIKKRVTYRGLSLHDPPSRAQSAANFSSSLPSSSYLQTPPFHQTKSAEEVTSTTISENRDDCCENLISLNDVHHVESSQFKPEVVDKEDVEQLCPGDSPGSANSLPSTDEGCFFSDSNSSTGLKGLQHLHQMPSSNAASALLGKTLSTLSEQRSMESDTSLSCLDTPSPPKRRADVALTQSCMSDSAQQSPSMLRAKHLPANSENPQTNQRKHKPILRLSSAPASLSTPSLRSSTNSQSCDISPAHLAATANSQHPSNHANNINTFLIQSEGTPLLCNQDFDMLQPRNDPAHDYHTSDC